MEEQLRSALEEQADDMSKDVAEQVREEFLKVASQAGQGADGLVEHVTPVEQRRTETGAFASGFTFSIDHPFAELHEFGGPIEPSYGKAKAMGWTRDEMYQSLEDCNEYVTRKRLLRRAMSRVD